MGIETRKIKFIQEFLNVQSEDTISLLERILKKEERISEGKEVGSMTKEEQNHRIDQSESDFENGRFKSSEELIAKYK